MSSTQVLILNLRDNLADLKHIYKFADKLNSDILIKIPRSKEISCQEFKRKTVIEEYPQSKIAKIFSNAATKILSCKKNTTIKLNCINEADFYNILATQDKIRVKG